MKLLLLHMHVIVNMKNLFEHTILGNMSWFFFKNLKAKNQGDPYLCQEPYAIICIVVDETTRQQLQSLMQKSMALHLLKSELHFLIIKYLFLQVIFQHQCCTKSKFSLHIDLHFCFWQQLFNTLTIINPKVSPFNQGCCSFHLIAFKSQGDISKNK